MCVCVRVRVCVCARVCACASVCVRACVCACVFPWLSCTLTYECGMCLLEHYFECLCLYLHKKITVLRNNSAHHRFTTIYTPKMNYGFNLCAITYKDCFICTIDTHCKGLTLLWATPAKESSKTASPLYCLKWFFFASIHVRRCCVLPKNFVTRQSTCAFRLWTLTLAVSSSNAGE